MKSNGVESSFFPGTVLIVVFVGEVFIDPSLFAAAAAAATIKETSGK